MENSEFKANQIRDVVALLDSMLLEVRSRRILLECRKINRIDVEKLCAESIAACMAARMAHEATMELVKKGAVEYQAIQLAMVHFGQHPELIANPAYSWEDHCQTQNALRGLAYPESERGTQRAALNKIPCFAMNQRIYEHFAKVVASPETTDDIILI